MDLSVLYHKQKYLIRNLFGFAAKEKTSFTQSSRKNSSCFFFPEGKSGKFFKVVKIKNVITGEKGQSIYQKVSFNTGNSLRRKDVSCELEYPGKSFRKQSIDSKSLRVFSPLTGVLIKVLQKEGEVMKNDTILVIDAMKMENKILAPKSGKLILSPLKEEQSIKTGDLLFSIEN